MDPIDSNINTLSDLIFKYVKGELTREEAEFLELWKAEDPGNAELFNTLLDEITMREGVANVYTARSSKERVRQRLKSELVIGQEQTGSRRELWKNTWLRYAAAVLAVTGLLTWLLQTNRPKEIQETNLTSATPELHDAHPGEDKASLTLADGTVIVLDSAFGGQLAQQGSSTIIQDIGSITYSMNRKSPAAGGQLPGGTTVFNTMRTPRGGQYRLTLADGTRVWLNAESAITFPVAFTGPDRRVKVEGEVYFEVAKDKSKPFRVTAGNTDIEVLGTSFNVNAYRDVGNINTTLLEGSVKIYAGGEAKILRPGQQAQVSAEHSIAIDHSPNIEEVIAWKNGLFYFENAGLEAVMQQLGRWYNVEIVYERTIPGRRFEGKIQRSLELSDVLESLSKNDIHFKIDKNKIVVY